MTGQQWAMLAAFLVIDVVVLAFWLRELLRDVAAKRSNRDA